MSTQIREATRDDILDMAKIVVAWERETSWMPEGTSEDMIVGLMDEMFDSREMYVVTDAVSGQVEGYMSVDPMAQKLGAIYLQKTGQGHGKALIDRAKEGREFLWLQTHQPNVAAHRFYEREGFAITDELSPEAPGEPAQYRMEWRA
ncbi:GNAT family N-acetyltransferase [Celeribacter sp. ULVN23_4]